MTVSRALRGDPALSPATRARIRQIAEEIGFRPDPKLSELMVYLRQNRLQKHTETLAFIHLFPKQRQPHSPTELRMLAGARRRAEQLGYQLEVFTVSPDDIPVRRLAGILYARGIRGAIIQASRGVTPEIRLIAENVGCAVIGSNVPDALPLHVVCNHHAHTMHTALHTLVERGYQCIGFYMMETIDHIVEHAWHSAFLYHEQKAGNVRPELTLLTDVWREEVFEDWFRLQRLDAVVTNHTAALDWMRAVGAEVPARAGFAHLDWSEAMTSCAGVDQNTEHVGAAAVDSVVRQVQCNERGLPAFQTTAMIKGTWRDGPTVRAAGVRPPPVRPARAARPKQVGR